MLNARLMTCSLFQFFIQIDAIITFVNGSDPKLMELIKQNQDAAKVLNSNNPSRYRDHDELKFLLRSIELFAGFINVVHLVVAFESQIPNWLDRNNSRYEIMFNLTYVGKLKTNTSTLLSLFQAKQF